MKRVVEPEYMDALPPEDPRAQRERADLRRVNFWMGNGRILRHALEQSAHTPPRRIVELGCGDGTLMLNIVRKWKSRPSAADIVLVDQQNVVSGQTLDGFRELGWRPEVVAQDVFGYLEEIVPCDCMVANLFLHHFQDEELARLFELAARQTRSFIACEPRRLRYARAARRSLWLIGCSPVTRHDAEISIRAGFCNTELSSLWPHASAWQLQEHSAGLFSHCFVARKVS